MDVVGRSHPKTFHTPHARQRRLGHRFMGGIR